MRLLAIPLMFVGSFLQSASASEPVAATPAKSACELLSPTYETHEVRCLLPASDKARHLKFDALFGGGHDDTLVSIQPSLDEADLACDGGGKTRSFAEDGDIRLECGFTLSPAPNASRHFRVTIRFSHAQFTGFDLVDQ